MLTERTPDEQEREDFVFGYRMADAIAALDIGQTIAVKDKAVVAVEAMEGTDEVIGRAGHLAGPACGSSRSPSRTRTCASTCRSSASRRSRRCGVAGATALSIDAGRTLVLDGEHVFTSANDAGIAIVGRPRSEQRCRLSRVRVAVIGVGHLGRHHARILAALEGASSSPSSTRARTAPPRARGEHRARRALTDYRELLGQVDAVTSRCRPNCTATSRCRFSSAGSSVLVEKPMARSLAEARRARSPRRAQSGATLAVGHTERYNPAVAAVLPLVTSPRFIEVHRLGVFPGPQPRHRRRFDLMIHDLDIILALVRSEVESIEAVGVPVLTPKYDIANARLRFASGCIANVTASRISKERVRKIRFFQPDAYISIDYAAQEVEGWRLVRARRCAPAIEGGPLPVERDEPLRRELADFVARRPRRRSAPLVDGEAGRRALELATRIAEKMESAVRKRSAEQHICSTT